MMRPDNSLKGKGSALRDQRWNTNFKKLEKYIKRHGTWRVKKSIDIRLNEWLKRQKRNYEHLSLDRRVKLKRVGVKGTYQMANDAWDNKYQELRLFKKTYGHLVVGKGNKSLFEWIHNQKWLKKNGKLPIARERKLIRLGFAWSGEISRRRHERWESMFKEFSQFKRKHGQQYILILNDHKDLHAWVKSQKHNKRKLSPERISRLNAIKFPWFR